MNLDNAKNSASSVMGACDGFGSKEARQMPLFKGDSLHFVPTTCVVADNIAYYPQADGTFTDADKAKIDAAKIKYPAFDTKEGHFISFTQICRNGNGLELAGKTNSDKITNFFALFGENAELAAKIADVKQRTSTYDGEESTTRYLFFKLG